MLKNPRVTIMPLPLYFYVPNFGGIVLSAKQLRIMQGLCTGIRTAFELYRENASNYQMKMWSEKFKWYFIKWAWRKVKYLDNTKDINTARKWLAELDCIGALDKPPFKWARKIRNNICCFIKCGCQE